MTRARIVKTNFTGGEVTPRLLGRADLSAFENGAARLKNVLVHPTGGVSRRPGFRYVATAPGPGRLLAFEFNVDQTYLFCLTDKRLDIYAGDETAGALVTPWTAAQLAECAWTQTADTLLAFHPDVPPQKITRTGAETWTIAEMAFVTEGDPVLSRRPFHKYHDADVTLTPSGITGAITLTASADVFEPGHVGLPFRIGKKHVTVTGVTSATEASADVIEELAGTEAEKDWEEPAFSSVRGWPMTAAFHQDRLCLGGGRDLPNRLWLSKSGDIFNFDLGEGLDDEAIEFPILSDQVNAIRSLFSGRHLQVFTSGAEWMLSGDPLTPTNVQLRQQTRVGSPLGRRIPPRDVDGATIFCARNGRELREFLFTDVEQAYQAADMAILAKHMFLGPVDLDYQPGERLLYGVLEDGRIAAVTSYRTEKVTAWSTIETDGRFEAVAVVGDALYALVDRGDKRTIERFDPEVWQDCAIVRDVSSGALSVGGLDVLEGRETMVTADGLPLGRQMVFGGRIVLPYGAKQVVVGLPYEHCIEALPPAFPVQGGASAPTAYRVVRGRFRLDGASSLNLDVGSGFERRPFRRLGEAALDRPAKTAIGEREVRGLGWRRDGDDAPWRIVDDLPLPFTLLSVALELKASD